MSRYPYRRRRFKASGSIARPFTVTALSAARAAARSAQWARYGNYWKNAKWLYKQVMYLKRMVNVEVKKFDAVVASTNITSTGAVYPLHEMAQGDTDQTRDGNSIKPLYNLLKINLVNNATAVNTRVRLLLVKDLQQVADTTPAVTDILDNSVASLVDGPLNNATVGRFKVLIDKTYTMTSVAKPVLNPKWYTKLFGHIRFNGAASTDIQKGGLFLVAVSDQATNYPTFSFNTRLGFTDN